MKPHKYPKHYIREPLRSILIEAIVQLNKPAPSQAVTKGGASTCDSKAK